MEQLKGRPNCLKIRQTLSGVLNFLILVLQTMKDIVTTLMQIFCSKSHSMVCSIKKLLKKVRFFCPILNGMLLTETMAVFRFRKKPKIVRGITTGLVCWDKSVIDWDYLEWFLRKDPIS